MGTTALVLGITGAALSLIPGCCIGAIACIIAITLGAIGVSYADSGRATNRNSAKAGVILGIAGLGLSILIIVIAPAF